MEQGVARAKKARSTGGATGAEKARNTEVEEGVARAKTARAKKARTTIYLL